MIKSPQRHECINIYVRVQRQVLMLRTLMLTTLYSVVKSVAITIALYTSMFILLTKDWLPRV